MCPATIRYDIEENIRRSRDSLNNKSVISVQLVELQDIAEALREYNNRLDNGVELTKEQLKKIQRFRRELLDSSTKEAEALRAQIARIRDRNAALRSINFIHSLEDEYDALDGEIRSRKTTTKRRAELLDTQREIVKTLKILQG